MTKQQTPEFCLCIDWETSGAAWGEDSTKKYQGISFGAVIANAHTFEPIKTLYREIKFKTDKYSWSIDAEKIHGLSIEHLEQNGVTQEQAAEDLAGFILDVFGTTKVMFLGHNTEFDKRFTNQLMMSVNVEFSIEQIIPTADAWIQLHHVLLDTSSTGFIVMGLYKSDLLFESMGLVKRGEHNALTDALYTLQTCATIRMLAKTALGTL